MKAEEYFIVSYSLKRGGRGYLDGTLEREREGRYLRVEKPASFMFGVSRTLSSALYLGARQTVAKSHPLLEVVVRNLEEKEVARLEGWGTKEPESWCKSVYTARLWAILISGQSLEPVSCY